jgi:hypothetical protein
VTTGRVEHRVAVEVVIELPAGAGPLGLDEITSAAKEGAHDGVVRFIRDRQPTYKTSASVVGYSLKVQP